MFPNKIKDHTTPDKTNKALDTVSKADILDVSRDLTLTDDSDLEQSPVKKQPTPVPKLKTPVAKKDSLNFGVLKKLPLTPKENITKTMDTTSPQAISSLLKSPFVQSSSILAPSSPVSTKPVSTNVELLDENSSSNSSSGLRKKKRKLQLSRSKTSVQ